MTLKDELIALRQKIDALILDLSPEAESLKHGEHIKTLGLSIRSENILARSNIFTIDQLARLTVLDARAIRGMGDISLANIESALKRRGLSFRGEPSPR